MGSNFLFLTERFPVLEKMGSLAEIYLYTDANTCLYKMGSLAETVVNYIFEFEDLKPPSGNDNTHANRIKVLQKNNMLSKDISDIFYVLRIKRNEAVHEGYDSFEECRTLIEMTYTLSVWFMQIYGEDEFEAVPFVIPDDIRTQKDYQKLLEENEKLSAELEKAQEAAMAIPVRPPRDRTRTRRHEHERADAQEQAPGQADGHADIPAQELADGHADIPAQELADVHADDQAQAIDRRKRADRANRKAKLSERETRYIIDVLIESDATKTEQGKIGAKKTFRRFQLGTMGFVAIFIGPLVLFTTSVTYKLKFPNSISETATIANRAGAILPFCLGALALFALTYAIVYAYDGLDKIFTVGMASGFTVVAMQMCSSAYIDVDRVGLLGVIPKTSNILHSLGAVIGFGSMIFWIMLCFRKSDRRKSLQTKEKHIRNKIYFCSGIAMILSLGLFILDSAGLFGDNFPVVFVAECAMLLFGGISCLIKGGVILRDVE